MSIPNPKKKPRSQSMRWPSLETTKGVAVVPDIWTKKRGRKPKGVKVFPTLADWKDQPLQITMRAGLFEASVDFKWRALEYFVEPLLAQQKEEVFSEIEKWMVSMAEKIGWKKALESARRHIFVKEKLKEYAEKH